MENLSYAYVYNKIYNSKEFDKKKYNVLTIFPFKGKNDRHIYWVTKHLQTIFNTQNLGKHISYSEYKYIKRKNRMAHLSMRLRLRKLQHKTIEHVWRPNGYIAEKLEEKFFQFS